MSANVFGANFHGEDPGSIPRGDAINIWEIGGRALESNQGFVRFAGLSRILSATRPPPVTLQTGHRTAMAP